MVTSAPLLSNGACACSPSRTAAQLRGPSSSNRSAGFSECVSWGGGQREAGGKGSAGAEPGGLRKSKKVCERCRVSGSGRCKHRLSRAFSLLSPFAIRSLFPGPRVRRVPTVFALTPAICLGLFLPLRFGAAPGVLGVRSGPREPAEVTTGCGASRRTTWAGRC